MGSYPTMAVRLSCWCCCLSPARYPSVNVLLRIAAACLRRARALTMVIHASASEYGGDAAKDLRVEMGWGSAEAGETTQQQRLWLLDGANGGNVRSESGNSIGPVLRFSPKGKDKLWRCWCNGKKRRTMWQKQLEQRRGIRTAAL
ncbi:hypothetical protein IWX49DRAFT_554100 [Phyllosticta citricarpa]